MKVRILTLACRDFTAGQRFYERQGVDVGEYFLDSVFADIDSLTLYGGIHRKIFGFHRLLAKRFPHAIYYRVEDGITVVVYRILDCRQDPAKTSRALRHAGKGDSPEY